MGFGDIFVDISSKYGVIYGLLAVVVFAAILGVVLPCALVWGAKFGWRAATRHEEKMKSGNAGFFRKLMDRVM